MGLPLKIKSKQNLLNELIQQLKSDDDKEEILLSDMTLSKLKLLAKDLGLLEYNNLQKDEGQLIIKDKQGNAYSILPKENEFLIHMSDLDHYPKDAKNSTVDRIVFATNVGFK